MRGRKSLQAALMLSTMMATAGVGTGMSAGTKRRFHHIPVDNTPKSPKYSFTDEEKEKLSSLGGKAKRKYLKELKEKYDA